MVGAVHTRLFVFWGMKVLGHLGFDFKFGHFGLSVFGFQGPGV